ncbi:hypothetical protein TrVFT333_005095 [Trichoderma virens FT-333]|nr:hypothetical protein TrVFT333_005095 [Trichoderma virens FT-333]
MTARKRMLEPGESRLLWQTNGKEHWEDLSSKQREAVEIQFALLDDVPKSLPRSVGEPTTTSRSIMKFGTAGVMIAGAASFIYWLM